jgi:hypothetical protein
VIDPVLPADPVEQHLDVTRGEPAGEHLAVVGEDLLGDTVAPERVGEVPAHRPARGSDHHAGAHDEAGVVIQAGEDLAAPTVCERQPTDDVHLPQLHRACAFPALEPTVAATPGTGIDQIGTLQRPIDARA